MRKVYEFNEEALTDRELRMLDLLLQASDRRIFSPKHGDPIHYINEHGTCNSSHWINDRDDHSIEIGNCFRTEEECEFMIEKLKVITKLVGLSSVNNTERIKWKDSHQYKWVIAYDHMTNRVYSKRLQDQVVPFEIVFLSKGLADQAIKAVGADKIRDYYFGKYYVKPTEESS